MRNTAKDKIKLILIRHAKTKSNNEKRYCGKSNDEDISREGIEELEENLKEGIYPEADMVFATHKQRTIHTAAIIYPKIKPVVIDEFDEIEFGMFEGKNYEELKNVPEYQEWIDSNAQLPFPNGESREEYCIRVKKGFEKAVKIMLQNNTCSAALVVHGGTIMAILSEYSGKNYYDSMRSNTHGYLCEFDPDKNTIRIISEI